MRLDNYVVWCYNAKKVEKVLVLIYIGKINIEMFKGVSSRILTDEVVLTDKQLVHILEKRIDTYEKYKDYLLDILQNPDYILDDPKHKDTALVLKKYDNTAEVVLRLSTDKIEKKNSIISMWEIKEPRLIRYLKTHKIVYKKD